MTFPSQIQSIVYLVFSVIGILIKNCSYSMVDSKFNYLLYLGYFFGESWISLFPVKLLS